MHARAGRCGRVSYPLRAGARGIWCTGCAHLDTEDRVAKRGEVRRRARGGTGLGELLAAMADATLVIDREGRVEHLNPAATRPFGQPPHALLGRSLFGRVSGGALREARARMVGRG